MNKTIPTPTNPTESLTESPTSAAVGSQEIRLSHPKNYLAVPLAIEGPEPTIPAICDYAVDAPEMAFSGARELGLIDGDNNVTALGDTVIVTGRREHGTIENALEHFRTLYQSQKRFIETSKGWDGVANRLAFQYAPTKHLIQFLRQQGELRLCDLTQLLWKRDPELAETVFLHPRITTEYELKPDTVKTSEILLNPDSYKSEAAFQLKAYLYHCGIIESRGSYTTQLNPESDIWRLKQ